MILVRQGGSRPKDSAQGSDPLWDNDPWLAARTSKPSQKTSAELLAPQMSFWVCEDGSEPVLLKQVEHGTSGLALLSPDMAQPFMDVGPGELSPDELAMLVWPPLRSDQCPSNLPSQEVQFPALSGSSLSILRGTLIQLGAKMIDLKKASEPFNTASTVTVFVEAYKADLAAQEWAQLRKSLNGYLASQLGFGQGFPGSWGAKLMSDSGTTVPIHSEVAVRATLFASIPEADLHRFLKLSGKTCWVLPRAGQPAYSTLRPIWTPQLDRQSALVASSKLATSLGLCRSRKHIGIRVLHADYEAARQVLLPGSGPAPLNIKG